MVSFGERISRGEAEDLSPHLPDDVEDAILEDCLEADSSAEKFVERVVELENEDEETPREHADACWACSRRLHVTGRSSA